MRIGLDGASLLDSLLFAAGCSGVEDDGVSSWLFHGTIAGKSIRVHSSETQNRVDMRTHQTKLSHGSMAAATMTDMVQNSTRMIAQKCTISDLKL